MAEGTLDLFSNPVRMRIVHVLYDGREATTAQLCRRFPDVSQATMYRHVAAMERAGALEVVREEKVRGAVERTYRLRRSQTRLTETEQESLTPDDLRRTMATIAAVMVSEFDRSLEASALTQRADLSLAQLSLWLTDDELAQLTRTLMSFVARHQDNAPQGRRRYLLTPIYFPLAHAPDHD